MNASSSVQFQFYPCRVQLFGLPPAATATTPPAPSRPSMAMVQRVSRNLFGAPDPGAISQLLQEETQKQRSYVLQRYSFDIKTAQPLTPKLSSAAAAAAKEVSTKNPLDCGLIAQELAQHEQRLQQEKCNLSRESGDDAEVTAEQMVAAAETTPPSRKVKCNYNNVAQIRRTVEPSSPLSSASSNAKPKEPSAESGATESSSERLKPYARQTLITDCYSLRKTKQFVGRPTATVPAASSSSTNSRSPQRQLEVLQLPKPMRVAVGLGAAAAVAATTVAAIPTTAAATHVQAAAASAVEDFAPQAIIVESSQLSTFTSPASATPTASAARAPQA